LDEQAFRYNERKHDDAEGTVKEDGERFVDVVGRIVGKRLTLKKLTSKDQELPPEIQP
jgi:hypothetical protein